MMFRSEISAALQEERERLTRQFEEKIARMQHEHRAELVGMRQMIMSAQTNADGWRRRYNVSEYEAFKLRERLAKHQTNEPAKVIHIQSAPQFSQDELNTILTLCHPDKHGGKESATRITQKLLHMRNR